jgi:hypothetical protein
LFHTSVKSSEGKLVQVCLFGSMDNFPHYLRAAPSGKGGWSSSAWYAIEELLESRGTVNTSHYDTDEQLAVEALEIALHQGESHHSKEHEGKPWTRGFTIGSADETEWFAIIYKDVVLGEGRSRWDSPADRILVGAPLWIRTALPQRITLYHETRKRAASGRHPLAESRTPLQVIRADPLPEPLS